MNAVVTYIFGNQEKLRDPTVVTPRTQYYVITDNPNLQSHIWNTIVVNPLQSLDVRSQVAVVKFNPFIIPASKYLIIDSSHQITSDLTSLFNTITDTKMCVKLHPKHVDIQTEIQRWKHHRNLTTEHEHNINEFIQINNLDGFKFPIYEGCFIGVSNSKWHIDLFHSIIRLLYQLRDSNNWFPSNQIILSFLMQSNANISYQVVDTKKYAIRYQHNTWKQVKE